ncbi:TetR/AcrR family transcriptional regulator [Pseudonocardia spinosispora]|uniref:TetR/AcrR family transcriptional regulator n=1 Tax=Pseudonocardia spinosispora TaxID=103441 RepID=UPI000407EB73|nr:TetR/AcrR family transcriptional regulator [Pseudonocardia spinosispora]
MTKSAVRQGEEDGSGPAARRGRPTGDHAAKRAALLEAAAAAIAQEGYANASLRNVARRAGYTTGAVTYYFANKEELVTALLESWFDSYDAMLVAVRPQSDVRAQTEAWLLRTTGDPEFWPVMCQLLAHARTEPALAAVIERRYAHFRRLYTSILETGQAEGSIRADIPADILADQLSAMADGWMMLYPLEPQRFTPDRVRTLLDATVALISPPATAHRPDEA